MYVYVCTYVYYTYTRAHDASSSPLSLASEGTVASVPLLALACSRYEISSPRRRRWVGCERERGGTACGLVKVDTCGTEREADLEYGVVVNFEVRGMACDLCIIVLEKLRCVGVFEKYE